MMVHESSTIKPEDTIDPRRPICRGAFRPEYFWQNHLQQNHFLDLYSMILL